MVSYPIKPSDISANDHLWDSFGNVETETSALLLVRLAQQNGDWRDFTKDEIDAFSGHDFWFNRLVTGNPAKDPIRQKGDGIYSFTHNFIAKCFLASPACKEVVS